MNGRHENHPADVQHPLRRRRLSGAALVIAVDPLPPRRSPPQRRSPRRVA
jgi:hypothetical protein